MQISRNLLKVAALLGLAFSMVLASAGVAHAQEGYDGYDGEDEEQVEECDPSHEGVAGYEGYDGYDGCDDETPTDPGDDNDTTDPIDDVDDATDDILPLTGGISMLAVAGAVAAAGIALRRMKLT